MSVKLPIRVPELEAIPEALFREPLEFIYADHYRQRCICSALDYMIKNPGAPDVAEWAGAILAYLERELPLHIADEEETLFPLLRQRSKPGDQIESILGLLAEEHARDEALAAALRVGLRRVAEGTASPSWDAFWHAAMGYSEVLLRHLSWENALVLPFARRCLSAVDIVDLGRALAARRGTAYPD